MRVADQLQDTTSMMIRSWRRFVENPYEPVCLIIYLSNQCNMKCGYCYAAHAANGHDQRHIYNRIIDEQSVGSAAKLVADHCARNALPLRVAFHGGGEPTVHWSLLQRLTEITRNIATEYKLEWWGYLATNGVLSQAQVRWVAEHFDLVGLSCDGPRDIQDNLRPLLNGSPSSPYVENTARMLKKYGSEFIIRSTITPKTVERQSDIAGYLIGQLGATKMRFEPVYRIMENETVEFKSTHADLFVENFFKAQEEASKHHCQLSYSGVRCDESHGSYCNILRNVLHLTPDGTATACFFDVGELDQENHPHVIGGYDRGKDVFILDQDRIMALKKRVGRIPERCKECINIYHCARECPEICMLKTNGSIEDREPGFRCIVNKRMAENWILKGIEI